MTELTLSQRIEKKIKEIRSSPTFTISSGGGVTSGPFVGSASSSNTRALSKGARLGTVPTVNELIQRETSRITQEFEFEQAEKESKKVIDDLNAQVKKIADSANSQLQNFFSTVQEKIPSQESISQRVESREPDPIPEKKGLSDKQKIGIVAAIAGVIALG